MEQSLANALTADGVCAAVGLSGAEFAARQLAEIPRCSASGQHCWDCGKLSGLAPSAFIHEEVPALCLIPAINTGTALFPREG